MVRSMRYEIRVSGLLGETLRGAFPDLDARVQRLLTSRRPSRLWGTVTLAVAGVLVALPATLYLT